MKKNYILLLLVNSFAALAQIPTGYYNTATGTGSVLKTQLYNIIKGHTVTSYSNINSIYLVSDRDYFYENDGTVLDMYSENPTGVDPYNYDPTVSSDKCGSYNSEMDCYNPEHVVPQSTFGSSSPMVSDAHHIPPTDGYVNNRRSNNPHGVVATATWTSLNGGKLGSSAVTGYSGTVFEPIDEFKGDFARMYFYFVTRYENTVASYSYAMFSGNSYPAIDSAFLDMLISWHTSDPVSAFEVARNNAIYTKQNNRNPYIDHPEYVGLVWGGGSCPADTQAPTAPGALTLGTITSSSIALSWTASTDNTGVTNYDIYVDGVKFASSGGATSYTLNGLNPSTSYSIYVVAKDCKGNISTASNLVNGTTLANTGGSCTGTTVENFENIPASSTSYTIYNWTNPTTNVSWTSTDSRTDQTINTRAILIRVGSLTSGTIAGGVGDLTVTTQMKFGSTVGTFDLNINGVFVAKIPYSTTVTTTTISDINVSGNITITINNNSNTATGSAASRVAFDDLTWSCYTPLAVSDFSASSFKIYPNPSHGKFNIDFKDYGNYAIEIYSVIGQKVLTLEESNKQNIEINNLTPGVYLIKVTKDSKSIVKKIVIN